MKNFFLTLVLFLTYGVVSAQNTNVTGGTTTTKATMEKDSVMHDHSGMHQTTKTKKYKKTAKTHRSGNPETNPGAMQSNSVKSTDATVTKSVKTGVDDGSPLEGSSPQTISDIVAPEGSLNSRVAPNNTDRNSSNTTVIDNSDGTTTTTTINNGKTTSTTTKTAAGSRK